MNTNFSRPGSVAIALAFLFLTGCSSFTKSGRQQAAYEKYIRKSSRNRVAQQKLFHSHHPQMPVTTTEPMESSGPQAVAENVP
ncbi:MAG: hypothetical protein H0X40_11955 [Chthoniobacterales bacterium]|nr:hypothetical protein [Chthoniobacterales bacterium]